MNNKELTFGEAKEVFGQLLSRNRKEAAALRRMIEISKEYNEAEEDYGKTLLGLREGELGEEGGEVADKATETFSRIEKEGELLEKFDRALKNYFRAFSRSSEEKAALKEMVELSENFDQAEETFWTAFIGSVEEAAVLKKILMTLVTLKQLKRIEAGSTYGRLLILSPEAKAALRKMIDFSEDFCQNEESCSIAISGGLVEEGKKVLGKMVELSTDFLEAAETFFIALPGSPEGIAAGEKMDEFSGD